MTEGDIRAIQHLKEAVANGKHWYLALLEAIKLWNSPDEYYNDNRYCYLIDGEAFDWLLLAERLSDEISESIPEKERVDLLFFDRPPLVLEKDRFKELIGNAKYQAYLNYLYGVLVEDGLVLAVVNEIRKERRVFGSNKDEDDVDRAYERVYGAGQQVLIASFRKEKRYQKRKFISLSELKEFAYWRFKYRLKYCDSSRMASDTKKALVYMQRTAAPKRNSL